MSLTGLDASGDRGGASGVVLPSSGVGKDGLLLGVVGAGFLGVDRFFRVVLGSGAGGDARV
jgi:hypothetical protein